jgi:broad specificity phosphatase PhoE
VPARVLVLVKHALPVVEPQRPPAEWCLGPEGAAQALTLAERLRRFLPLRLIASPEPKALGTCEVIAEALGSSMTVIDDLREFDRPAMRWMSPDEHERANAELFLAKDRPVLGRESATDALARFEAAVQADLGAGDDDENVVVVAHGTVISLFVGKHTAVDDFELWKRLACPSFVVMAIPNLELIEIEASAE